MTFTLNRRKIAGWLAVIASVIAILASLHQLGCNAPLPKHKTVQTQHAALRLRPDSIIIHDTIRLTRWRIRAQANWRGFDTIQPLPSDTPRVTAARSMPSGLSPDSALSCLDTLISTGDTAAIGPDTMSICHDMITDRFYIAIQPAARRLDTVVTYLARDSIIDHFDATTITRQAPGDNIFDQALRIIGAIAIGFFLGKVL